MINLDDLEAKAKAATPGPWRYNGYCGVLKWPDNCEASLIAGTAEAEWRDCIHCAIPEQERFNNGAFIFAAQPLVVLELIHRIRELETNIKEATQYLREQDNQTTLRGNQ